MTITRHCDQRAMYDVPLRIWQWPPWPRHPVLVILSAIVPLRSSVQYISFVNSKQWDSKELASRSWSLPVPTVAICITEHLLVCETSWPALNNYLYALNLRTLLWSITTLLCKLHMEHASFCCVLRLLWRVGADVYWCKCMCMSAKNWHINMHLTITLCLFPIGFL